jgi:hypothetical protein
VFVDPFVDAEGFSTWGAAAGGADAASPSTVSDGASCGVKGVDGEVRFHAMPRRNTERCRWRDPAPPLTSSQQHIETTAERDEEGNTTKIAETVKIIRTRIASACSIRSILHSNDAVPIFVCEAAPDVSTRLVKITWP